MKFRYSVHVLCFYLSCINYKKKKILQKESDKAVIIYVTSKLNASRCEFQPDGKVIIIFVISIGTYKTEKSEYRRNKFSSSLFPTTCFLSHPVSPCFLPFARVHEFTSTYSQEYMCTDIAEVDACSRIFMCIKTSTVHDTNSLKITGIFVVNIAEISLAFDVIPSTNGM